MRIDILTLFPEMFTSVLDSSMLGRARERARTMSQRGALFAWRGIDGEECSAYYPAGTAQAHIDADIAFAIERYVSVTGDTDFLIGYGAEMLLETARFYADLGFYNPRRGGAFCIHCVTGPDEYNVLVDNNVYTNLMARENMRYARETLLWMRRDHPAAYANLAIKCALAPDELDAWRLACEKMYVPYDEESGLYPQDDGFLDRAPWPLTSIPKENFPLLLHYHPLVIYRHMVCKQADLILAMVMLGDRFSREEKERNFLFYDRVTTHDSSLSMTVFSILASELNRMEKAYEYFESTARFDLDDRHSNTKDGLHMANMAGSWMALAQGFGGMRADGNGLSFAPKLPDRWSRYAFSIRYRGRILRAEVRRDGVEFTLVRGEEIAITVYQKSVTMCPSKGTGSVFIPIAVY